MRKPAGQKKQRPVARKAVPAFPIVGIGASAGGMEAFMNLLHHLPTKTGLAFVLVQHLDPTRESSLRDLLARKTNIPVQQASDGMIVKPDQVYVMPPNVIIRVEQGRLRLQPRMDARGLHMPIDHFFRSLAGDQENRAIGIVLSGTGSDGALGLWDIKDHGGITFVQEPKSAKFSGMPASAITGGAVDYVLPPERIANELARMAQHPYVTSLVPAHAAAEDSVPRQAYEEDVAKILRLLRGATGVDFTHYRQTTVLRRIHRRMTLHKLEHLGAYCDYLKGHSEESYALYHDLLIKVSGFFRDPRVFEALKDQVFPWLASSRSKHPLPIRIWVPGCAGGEEAYSITIALLEWLGDRASKVPIQVFATDIDERSLEKARAGLYLENIRMDVSPERLRRFFTKHDHQYRISRVIRAQCTFARHNVFKDPPFCNLDLISCRNVLIYLDAALQRKVIPLFHYALNDRGFLLLGISETIGSFTGLFKLADKKVKLYAKHTADARPQGGSPRHRDSPARAAADRAANGESVKALPWGEIDVHREADRIALQHFAPAGVLVNNAMEILQFRGDTSRCLVPAPGKASLNLLKMAREGLLPDLRAAIDEAAKTGPVRREGVQVRYEGKPLNITLHVIPLLLPASASPHLLVLFQEQGASMRHQAGRAQQRRATGPVRRSEATRLRQELEATKQFLQLAIEEKDTTNEELRSANEEVLSSNEELQSINQELQTAKEELQSMNEELSTVNEELNHRNLELTLAYSDLTALFTTLHVPLVMLSSDFRIRRFTPVTEKFLNLLPTDVGRPIGDLKLAVEIPDLDRLLQEALDTVTPQEREVQDRKGHWHLMRIRPHKTLDNKIEGVMLFFIDVNSIKDVDRLTALLRGSQQLAAIVESSADAIIGSNLDGFIQSWNQGAERIFGYRADEVVGRHISILIPPGSSEEEAAILERLRRGYPVEHYETERLHKDGRRLKVSLTVSPIKDGSGRVIGIAKIARDLTERKKTEEALAASLREKEVLLKEIHHRVKNNLQVISSMLNLQAGSLKEPKALQALRDSQSRIRSMALVHEQLYQSKDLNEIDAGTYLERLVRKIHESSARSASVRVRAETDRITLGVGTAIPCGLIVNELVVNALEHAFSEGRPGEVRVQLRKSGEGHFELTVGDNGTGLPDTVDIQRTETLGLRLINALTDQLAARLTVERKGGTTFRITW